MATSERIASIVSENRVKLHVFEPSMKTIWTVVGKSKEYWIDPDAHYCSCSGYHFDTPSDKKTCYHLESSRIAASQQRIETVRFSDDEFSDFIRSLVSEL